MTPRATLPPGPDRATATRPAARAHPRRTLAATAVACGVSVASIYYAQPLLPALGAEFHAPRAAAAVVVTTGQLGYAAGLLLIVPLGDLHDRRRLAVRLLALTAPALALAAAAPTLWLLALAALAFGATSSAAQVLVALTAANAPGTSRGRAVGTVMTGLTAGILLSRVAAGTLTQLTSWRTVYALAAALVTATAWLAHRALPAAGQVAQPRGARNCATNQARTDSGQRTAPQGSGAQPQLQGRGELRDQPPQDPQPTTHHTTGVWGAAPASGARGTARPTTYEPADDNSPTIRGPGAAPRKRAGGWAPYLALLRSTAKLAVTTPPLRRRCAYGAAAFAAFSTFWTPSALLLSAPPFRFTESAVGAFALAGLAGVALAHPAGRLADHGHARAATGASLALMAASFAPLLLGRHSLPALAAGAILLDLGLRGAQTANQQQIYRLPPTAHSRVTTAYMTSYFIGGAIGSAASAAVYAHAGWPGVCALGAALATAPLLLWLTEPRRSQGEGQP